MGRLARLRQSAGKGNRFIARCQRLRQLGEQGAALLAESMPRSRADARALSHLWLVEPEFRDWTLTRPVLEAFARAQAPRLSRQTHLNLLALYLQAFDELDRPGPTRAALADVLASLWPTPRRSAAPRGVWNALARSQGALLRPDGPARIAQQARLRNEDLLTWVGHLGLTALFKGRFAQLCLGHFYLDELAATPTGTDAAVLGTLADPQTCNLPFENGQRLGHAALAEVIDRGENHPGERWLQWILDIAGDPRTAKEAANRRQWWNMLGEGRRQRVLAWLGRSELALFLEALEMERGQAEPASEVRFQVRETFLNGLADCGLLHQARLIAGEEVIDALRAGSAAPESLDRIARLEGSGAASRAILYLHGRGFHMLESTRDWRSWLSLDLPHPDLADANRDRFTVAELQEQWPARYSAAHPGDSYTACSHGPSWARHIIGFLTDHGVALDLSRVLSPQHYRQYLARYGEPIVRTRREH